MFADRRSGTTTDTVGLPADKEMGDASLDGTPCNGAGAAVVLLSASVTGAIAGALAEVLMQIGGRFAYLGSGVAFWMTAGFLVTRLAVPYKTSQAERTVWAGATMVVYLLAWIFAFCVAYGTLGPSSLWVAWYGKLGFVIFAPVLGALIGVAASLSLRPGWIGDACIAAPIAWSLPEVVVNAARGWQSIVAVSLPTLLIALVTTFVLRRRDMKWPVLAGSCVIGAVAAFYLLQFTVRIL